MKMGLVGTNGSGKTEICRYMREKGAAIFSLSEIVRKEARARGLREDRDTLISIGNELKKNYGLSVLAERCFQTYLETKPRHVVFDSIRNVEEASFLTRHNVHLIGIDAPIELRYQRIQNRKNETDRIDIETFKRQDKEENEGKSFGQHIYSVFPFCEIIIQNTGDLSELYSSVDRLVFTKKVRDL